MMKTPTVLPAISSIIDIYHSKEWVIENLEPSAAILKVPAVATNHLPGKTFNPGSEHVIERYRRHRLMNGYTLGQITGFAMATYPMVNEDTGLALSTNPRTGKLRVQRFEANGPAIQVFDLSHHAGARRTKGVL